MAAAACMPAFAPVLEFVTLHSHEVLADCPHRAAPAPPFQPHVARAAAASACVTPSQPAVVVCASKLSCSHDCSLKSTGIQQCARSLALFRRVAATATRTPAVEGGAQRAPNMQCMQQSCCLNNGRQCCGRGRKSNACQTCTNAANISFTSVQTPQSTRA